jgi:hypothetical protein
MTGWAVLGLEAAGVNPLDLDHGDATPISYLAGNIGEIATTGDLERTILVLRGAGLDARHFQGHDLVSRLLARRGKDGSWGGQVNQTAFGLLALKAAGASSGGSAAWLRDQQNSDGGWGFAAGTASDADTTGAVLQALAASGNSAGIRRGTSYLRGVQRPGGGFPLSGGVVNAQSTAYAAQGLIAAGVSPASVREGGHSPLDYLASVQARDGHYRYSSSSDQTPVWVTGQALLAVNGAAFPLAPVPRTASAAAAAPVTEAKPSAAQADSGAQASKPARKAAHGVAAEGPPADQPATLRLAPTSSSTDHGGGGGAPAWLIAIVVIAAATAAVWWGWVLYRRRLRANRAS